MQHPLTNKKLDSDGSHDEVNTFTNGTSQKSDNGRRTDIAAKD